MMDIATPTRSEMRLVSLAFEVSSTLSFTLARLVGLARVGWLDGLALYEQLGRQGLEPVWVTQDNSPAIQLVDPVAGPVVLRCETITQTLH